MFRIVFVIYIFLSANVLLANEIDKFQITQISEDQQNSFEDEFVSKEKIFDPLEGYNRFMTVFNDIIFTYAFRPISKAYKAVLPYEIRDSISNFFDNLAFPLRFINNLLQAKFKNAGEEIFGFVVNTTLGIGGLAEPSRVIFGIQRHKEDFGQTLGYWGVGSGFPLVLPLLGPSNLRDAFSYVPDYYSSVIAYIPDPQSTVLMLTKNISELPLKMDGYFILKKDAIDLYPYLQNFYENMRNQEIKN